MDSTFSPLRLAFGAGLLAAAAAVLAAPQLNHDTVVPPLPAGRFPVACSNIEQDASRIAPGASASDYWEGRPVNDVDHYVSELLTHPETAVTYDAAVPDVRRLYPGHAGDQVRFVAIVCFPTSRTNDDPDYALPGMVDVIPRMQPAGTAPKLIPALELETVLGVHIDPPPPPTLPARLPVIVFSHGLTGSPISSGYVQVMVQLAAQGYLVAAPFHGDPRFARVRVEDMSDVVYLVRDMDRIVEMQLMRPLALKTMLDVLLADPHYGASIQPAQIGAFGASLGGEAVALLTGAKLTTSWDLACDEPVRDPRIRAAVGYVPYAGQPFLPAFCAGQSGAAGVNRPFLAISGSADTTAPLPVALQAAENFGASRYFVGLVGGQHELRPEDVPSVFSWTLTFLNAYMQGPYDSQALARLFRMKAVNGGGREQVLALDVHVPTQQRSGQWPAKEFHNTATGHYFMAASPIEIDGILHGSAGPGWELTGQAFNVWGEPTPGDNTAPVCRFYSPPFNSHFFTQNADECELVKHNPDWRYEGIGFHIRPVGSDGRCPPGYLGVNRAYNNGEARNDGNHRFTTSDSTIRDMVARGWTAEGMVMCMLP